MDPQRTSDVRNRRGKELMKKWGIPENFAGVGALALGYADCELPEPKERREGRIIYADK